MKGGLHDLRLDLVEAHTFSTSACSSGKASAEVPITSATRIVRHAPGAGPIAHNCCTQDRRVGATAAARAGLSRVRCSW